jgi:hypothetical protein
MSCNLTSAHSTPEDPVLGEGLLPPATCAPSVTAHEIVRAHSFPLQHETARRAEPWEWVRECKHPPAACCMTRLLRGAPQEICPGSSVSFFAGRVTVRRSQPLPGPGRRRPFQSPHLGVDVGPASCGWAREGRVSCSASGHGGKNAGLPVPSNYGAGRVGCENAVGISRQRATCLDESLIEEGC